MIAPDGTLRVGESCDQDEERDHFQPAQPAAASFGEATSDKRPDVRPDVRIDAPRRHPYKPPLPTGRLRRCTRRHAWARVAGTPPGWF